MKTLVNISRVILVAVAIVLVSTNLQAQKAYRNVTLERGIVELNGALNNLIEKCKIKFDINNTLSVNELKNDEAVAIPSENELNELADQLALTVKFFVNKTISVTEANEQNSELNQLTESVMETIKFDVNKTISVSGLNDQEIEINEFANKMMENIKFDVNKTISVQEIAEAF